MTESEDDIYKRAFKMEAERIRVERIKERAIRDARAANLSQEEIEQKEKLNRENQDKKSSEADDRKQHLQNMSDFNYKSAYDFEVARLARRPVEEVAKEQAQKDVERARNDKDFSHAWLKERTDEWQRNKESSDWIVPLTIVFVVLIICIVFFF